MWLIGMMGSGKSTVGSLAARELAISFYDTDVMISERTGMSIPEIWEQMGEEGFRELEHEAVSSVPADGIAAAGGGAVLDERNREVMASSPPVIWLRAQPGTMARRVAEGEERPLLASRDAESRLSEILGQRSQLYQDLATHVLDTDDLTPDQVTTEVVSIWRS